MGASITLAGESLIAQKQAAREPVQVVRFVLANVPNLDTTKAVNRSAGRPVASQIVYTANVTREGYLSPNQVVYSLLLTSEIGDFNFNWMGLETADGTLLIVAYVPLQQKRKEIAPNQAGNNLTRNIVWEYNGAQSLSGITVPAQTWQFDFSTLFAKVDTRLEAIEATLLKKLDLDNWTPPPLVNMDGPTLVYPGSTNTYKITDYHFGSAWAVATSVGTVARNGDTITLTIPSNAVAGVITLTVTRDDTPVAMKIPLGSAAISKPSVTSPTAAATGIGFEPTLTSSAFTVFPAGFNSHTKTRWQLATDAAFTNLVLDRETTANLRSLPIGEIPLRLQPSTRYYLRVRYFGTTLTSDWSDTLYFNTASVYVRKPTLTSPSDGSTKISLAGKLTGDAFSVYGGSDIHDASRWQISTVADFSTQVQDSGWSITQLTEFLSSANLAKNTQHYARVAYRGRATGQSEWSATVGFITGSPLLGNYSLVNSGATVRAGHTTTTIGNAIYIAGGYSSAAGLAVGKTLWRYDFTALAWQQKASLAVSRDRHAAATAGGMLYLFGGSSDGGTTAMADLTRYNPATDAWATLQVGPSARVYPGFVELGGDLYIVGGQGAGNVGRFADVWKYTIVSNSWVRLADLPAAISNAVVEAVGGKIYAYYAKSLYIYDPVKNEWSTGADSPINNPGATASAVVSGLLYTVGGLGSDSTSAYNAVQEYDPATNSWRRLANFPVTRYGASGAEYNGSLYVFGGQQINPSIYTNTFYRID